jgi:predicted transcriptional regulator
MSTTKEAVIKIIEQMPEEVSIVDIMAELYFCQKVDAGLKDLDEGKGIPHEQVKERLRKWLSRDGPPEPLMIWRKFANS